MPLQGKYDVKLGSSFMECPKTSFMTMRCDFLPASVDRNEVGTISISNEKEVGVRLPNVSGAEPSTTLFKGNMRPVNKECLLILNKTTGELTLERISKAAQLKKSRDDSAPKKPELEHPSSSDNLSSLNSKLKMKKMSESSSDDEPKTKLCAKDVPLVTAPLKHGISPGQKLSSKNPTSVKTYTLSSSSDSDGSTKSNSVNRALLSARSSISSLSDLDTAEPPSSSKLLKTTSFPLDKPMKAVTNSPLSIHRNLMENDLLLSESDSEEG